MRLPLKPILSGTAVRCSAKAKSTGERCWRLASFGCRVCYVHGARRPETVPRGRAHWAYKDGRATKEQREKDRKKAIELRLLEEISFALGLASGERWIGRKPKGGE